MWRELLSVVALGLTTVLFLVLAFICWLLSKTDRQLERESGFAEIAKFYAEYARTHEALAITFMICGAISLATVVVLLFLW